MSMTDHERIAKTLTTMLDDLAFEERELTEQLAAVRARQASIRAAVKAERWWEIKGLPATDIEALCAESPADLLGAELGGAL